MIRVIAGCREGIKEYARSLGTASQPNHAEAGFEALVDLGHDTGAAGRAPKRGSQPARDPPIASPQGATAVAERHLCFAKRFRRARALGFGARFLERLATGGPCSSMPYPRKEARTARSNAQARM